MRNVSVGEVAEAILKINFYYGERDTGQFTPRVRNINMENVTSKKSRYALSITAYDRSPATDINLKNCIFENVERASILDGLGRLTMENVKINPPAQR